MIKIELYQNRCEFEIIISLNHASNEAEYGGDVLELDLQNDTKLYGEKYYQVKNEICDCERKCLLLAYSSDIFLANRLLWECDNVSGIIYVDSDNPYIPERMVRSRDRILWNVQAGFSKDSDKAFMSGWKNSYDNEMFSHEEIVEYVEDTKEKLEHYLNKEMIVLEIGCGSGMISEVLSPLVGEYNGCDISDAVLNKLRIMNATNRIENMPLYNYSADEIGKIGKQFDIILSSSVTEYFSGVNYLRYVVGKCIDSVNDNGIIYFGDVFDLDLRDEYINSVEEFRKVHRVAKPSNSFAFELFISPRFWHDLAATDGRITEVNISRKIGKIYNEINRFRYDVILKICKDNKKICVADPYLYKYQFAGNKI